MAEQPEMKFRFTTKGQQISVETLGGKEKIEFTKAAASIDVHYNDTDDDVANIIDLDNKKQIVDITKTVAVKDNVVQIPIPFKKNEVEEDYLLNTVGIYVSYKGEEVLYAFGALKHPQYMQKTDDSGVFKLYAYLTVGTVENVVIKTSDTESVSHEEFDDAIKDLSSKDDLTAAQKTLMDEIKTLYPLNSPDGNNIYDTTINLDTYSTVGTTKFLGCKLQSTGQMTGFKQDTEKLYGWIFNIPKWNGATEFQQIVYICNYGDGTLTYVRSRVNNEGKNKEDFEKILTDKDLKAFADKLTEQIKNAGQVKTVDGKAPDAAGNVETDHYTKAEIDQRVTDINSRVEAEEHREWTHHADTYDAGLDYSKAHPDVLVSTP